MSLEDKKKVFDLLWCSSNRMSRECNPNGNGLGLYICKQICKGLGGDIVVESAVGQGTAFLFSIKASLPNGTNAGNEVVLLQGEVTTTNQGTTSAIQSVDSRQRYNQMSDGSIVENMLEDCQVKFQGIVFNIDEFRVQIEINQTIPSHMDQLIEFIHHTQQLKKEQKTLGERIVVYADDQFINRKLMLVQWKELKRGESLVDFHNGQEIVDYFEWTLNQISEIRNRVVQPVSLLLLDINMPILNGYDTLKKVKQLFKDFNDKRDPASPLVLRPMICYLSSSEQEVMRQFLTKEE